MQQQSINTTDAAAGNPAGAFCNAGRMDAGLLDNAARILDELVPLVIMTHVACEGAAQAAIQEIDGREYALQKSVRMRVLD